MESPAVHACVRESTIFCAGEFSFRAFIVRLKNAAQESKKYRCIWRGSFTVSAIYSGFSFFVMRSCCRSFSLMYTAPAFTVQRRA